MESIILVSTHSILSAQAFDSKRLHLHAGTGLLSVVGTSFTIVGISQSVIKQLYANGTCATSVVDGVTTYLACPGK